MTSVTTLLALVALYVFGGEVIVFVSAMIWGVVIGTYSSIFIASPLIVLFGFKYKNNTLLIQIKILCRHHRV